MNKRTNASPAMETARAMIVGREGDFALAWGDAMHKMAAASDNMLGF